MTSPTAGVCTIAAKNYISFARTLFLSLQKQHPDIRCYVLIIDDWKDFLKPADEPFEILSLSNISVPNVIEMAFKYNVTEFSTAVKPFLLEHLFVQKGFEKLLYLDPDILVTGSLDKLFNALDEHDFLITPHLDTDYPEDGLTPDDRHILISGVFNLGFLGIRKSQTSESFLKWWQQKLKTKCIIDHAVGYFVDQRFIDLAITLFPNFYIERDTGYNVAYWNLHSRYLSFEQNTWKCNGGPLYFFHFSSYKLEQPDLISCHASRFSLENRPDLKSLFNKYRRRLMENGYMETYQWPYSFGTFADGTKITYEMRSHYRTAVAKGIQVSDPFQSRKDLAEKIALDGKVHCLVSLVKNLARSLTPPILWKGFKSINDCFGNSRQ